MKNSLIALAVLAASGAVMAQSTVTLYGRLDVGVSLKSEETKGPAPLASSKLSQTKVDSNDLYNSFWGMKGSEDLGGGLKAIFNFQQQFTIDNGAASNTLFEREANVGFEGAFGTVKLGRVYVQYDDIYNLTNNIANSNMATTSAVWKIGSTTYAVRNNNGISYVSPVMSGFSGGIGIGLGENKTAATATTNGDPSRWLGFKLKYAAGPLMVGFAYDEAKPANGGDATKNTLLGGTYNFGVAKVVGSINQGKLGPSKDDEYQVGVNVPVPGTAAIVMAGYSHSKNTLAGKEKVGSGWSLVGMYDLSKRTSLYAGYSATKMDGAAVAANVVEKTNLTAGVRHLF